MKAFVVLLFILTSPLYAEEMCDNENPNFLLPNCYTPENIRPMLDGKPDSLCTDCKQKFERVYGKISEDKTHLQNNVFDLALKEYKKNITNNIVSAMKLRTLLPDGAGTLSKSMAACKMPSKQELVAGCKSEAGKKLIQDSKFFEDLSNDVAREVAAFLNTEPGKKTSPTLLERTDQSCFIPERELLFVQASAVEDSLSESFIKSITALNPSDYESVSEMFEEMEGLESFSTTLQFHPVLSLYTKTPADFISFLKSIPSPATKENLSRTLYSSKSAENIDKSFAEGCEKSLKNLAVSICSEDFEKGAYSFEPKNLRKLVEKAPQPLSANLDDELIDINVKVLELCENKVAPGKPSLTTLLNGIGTGLTSNQKNQPLGEFQIEKYKQELGGVNKFLCENDSAKCANNNSYGCFLFRKYQDLKSKPDGIPSKLASSSNGKVNDLLRAMIGIPSKIDSQTRSILVEAGILPKDDGTLVAQPEVAERKLENYVKQPATPGSPVQTKYASNSAVNNGATQSAARNNYSAPGAQSASSYVSQNNSVPSPSGAQIPDFSDIVQNNNELREIQNEIKRRLTASDAASKTVTKASAKKATEDAFRARGVPLSPYQSNAIADRIVANNSSTPFQTNDGNRAEVSGGDNLREQFVKEQDRRALMGMQGAQRVMAQESHNRSPASAGSITPQDLTKVAINVPEDPKIKLSEIFAQKIDQNAPETQLLKVLMKSRSDFLLQVKSVNFRIIFTNNQYKIVPEPGSSEEAEKIRPQLETFLRRLRV